ncbi:MAG: YbaK/EbsC family protein [Actinomycetota bacterium]|nr:YbaK/EbsC family protein [Actinomycetota bacterium]
MKKASFASPEETIQMTGMVLGGVTPLGLPPTLPVWIDSRIMDCARVIVGGGSRDRKVYLDPRGLKALPSTEIIENLAMERSAGT